MSEPTYFRVTPGKKPTAASIQATSTVVENIMGPYSVEELKVAFLKVCDAQDWKAPVDREVVIGSDDERDLIRRAITMWTGSEPAFTPLSGRQYRITAPGYREVIGT